ncbi:MAG: molecular chaperone TorD family protein, partial [Chloroflexi bacterium]|nr:molecular chaperone TorD family protein [Chloroflexota bacterium]
MKPETNPYSQRYRELALAFCPPGAGAARDLTLAYTRLFLGPGRPLAHPYESVVLEGRLMGAAAAQIAACYAQAGLHLSAAQRELPDHISVELAFMAHLAAREERDPLAGFPDRRRFLREHLARWLPQFCERVEASGAHPFYSEAARAARELVEADMARAAIRDCGLRIPHPPPTRHPEPATRRRYPNICLGVDPARCTLCTLCADACRPGALSAECAPTTISLTFDPARCNG